MSECANFLFRSLRCLCRKILTLYVSENELTNMFNDKQSLANKRVQPTRFKITTYPFVVSSIYFIWGFFMIMKEAVSNLLNFSGLHPTN